MTLDALPSTHPRRIPRRTLGMTLDDTLDVSPRPSMLPVDSAMARPLDVPPRCTLDTLDATPRPSTPRAQAASAERWGERFAVRFLSGVVWSSVVGPSVLCAMLGPLLVL